MTVEATERYDPAAFRAVFERHFTYLAGVERNAHRFANRPALHDPATGRRWTYAELWRDAERVAAGLAELGAGPRDVVAFSLLNGPEFALLWLGAQRLGAIPAPVNFRLSAGEVAFLLDDARPVVFAFDGEVASVATTALERARHRPRGLVVAGEHPGATSFDALLATDAPVPPAPETTAWDEATRLYTSGTTGMPKGVPMNNVNAVLSAHDVVMHFPLTPQDKTLNMTPWFHRGGLDAGGPNPVFYVGAEAVPLRAFHPATVLDRVQELGLTFLIGAPTNLELLHAEQIARPRDLSTLRGIVTMGAPLDRAACLRYQEVLTERIFNGYGTTEAFWNTFLRPDDLPGHAGSAGRACTDDDVAVVRLHENRRARPDETVAKDDTEVGEVAVRSPKSGGAYVGEAGDDERFQDGWLFIGDLATWDADEYVTIVGRRDDMLISGGENVHPVQVEGVLEEHPDVAEAAVVGLPDERWGQVVTAYVVRTDPALDAAALEGFCREHPMLAPFKRPRAYVFVDALPRTATGKKKHFQLRERLAQDAASGALVRP